MVKKTSIKVGIIQAGPVWLDRVKSLEKARVLMERATAGGAELLVFGETWFSGYPAWLDSCPGMAIWDDETGKDLFLTTYRNSITVPGEETAEFCRFARERGVVIVMGVNEVVPSGPGNGTIYNTLLTIDTRGAIVNHHRKLMPTFSEKLIYGTGDGHGLTVPDTDFGRIGGLICWEHWMPLARQAMHNSGEHLHVAVWPWVHDIHQLASRHYAFEARCFVIAVGQIMRGRDFPGCLTLPPELANQPDQMVLKGGSCIIGPNGQFELEPQLGGEEVIVHEITNLDRVVRERMTLDTSGHYSRADVFDFSVHRERPATS